MFKLVKKLGTLVARLYRAEAVRLSKLSDAQADEAQANVEAAQELLRRSDDMVQASRDSRLAALDIQSKAKQLETLF